MSSLNPSIHGHAVMHLMLESGATYTEATLRDAIAQRFGADARFHTCSAENLTADELIEFLAARGKFVPASGGFRLPPDQLCQHES